MAILVYVKFQGGSEWVIHLGRFADLEHDRDTKPISPICQVLFSNELRVKHHGVRMKHGGSTKMTRLVVKNLDVKIQVQGIH